MSYRVHLRSGLLIILCIIWLIPALQAQKNATHYSVAIEMQGVSHLKGPYRINKVIDQRERKDTLGIARTGNLNKPVPIIAAQPIEKSFEVYINSFFNHCPECRPFTMVITKIELSELDEAASQHAVAIIEAEFYQTDSTGAEVLFHTTMGKSKTAHRDATAWLEEDLRKAIGMVLDDLGKTVERSSIFNSEGTSEPPIAKQNICTMEFNPVLNRFMLCGKPNTTAMVMNKVDAAIDPALYTQLEKYKSSRDIGTLLVVLGGVAMGLTAAQLVVNGELIPALLIGGATSSLIGLGVLLTSKDAAYESARLFNLSLGVRNIESSIGKKAFVAGYTWQF